MLSDMELSAKGDTSTSKVVKDDAWAYESEPVSFECVPTDILVK